MMFSIIRGNDSFYTPTRLGQVYSHLLFYCWLYVATLIILDKSCQQHIEFYSINHRFAVAGNINNQQPFDYN